MPRRLIDDEKSGLVNGHSVISAMAIAARCAIPPLS